MGNDIQPKILSPSLDSYKNRLQLPRDFGWTDVYISIVTYLVYRIYIYLCSNSITYPEPSTTSSIISFNIFSNNIYDELSILKTTGTRPGNECPYLSQSVCQNQTNLLSTSFLYRKYKIGGSRARTHSRTHRKQLKQNKCTTC